jgi:hypothetical protein
VIFEELLEREQLITEATFDNPADWRAGKVHSDLFEGQIVRMTTEIQILDPVFFRQRVAQLERLGRALVGLQSPGTSAGGSKASARNAERAALRQLFGDANPEMLKEIGDFVSAFTNDTIMVRVLPCGKSNLDCHFAGVLLGRSEYIQEEREALFSRHGTTLNDWTILMQIARIPEEVHTDDDNPVTEADKTSTDVFAKPSLDRASIEQMAISMVDVMEQEGLAEGLKWPAVSVTPLAIYREFA